MIVFKQYFFHLEEITRMCMSSIFVSIQDFHEVDVLYEFCQKQKKTIRNLEREIEQMRRVNIKDMIHFSDGFIFLNDPRRRGSCAGTQPYKSYSEMHYFSKNRLLYFRAKIKQTKYIVMMTNEGYTKIYDPCDRGSDARAWPYNSLQGKCIIFYSLNMLIVKCCFLIPLLFLFILLFGLLICKYVYNL